MRMAGRFAVTAARRKSRHINNLSHALWRALIEQIRRDVQRPMLTGIALPGSISPLTGLIKNANIQVINGHALQADLRNCLGNWCDSQ